MIHFKRRSHVGEIVEVIATPIRQEIRYRYIVLSENALESVGDKVYAEARFVKYKVWSKLKDDIRKS